ncbi:MAG: hypothetical protein ACOX0C_01650 [Patescibacteria group bacterium]|jgi:hypothetical protein
MKRFSQILIISLFLLAPFLAKGAVCNDYTELTVVARDPSGNYIANATVELYTQEIDANGEKKPDKRLATAKVNANLGTALLRFRNSNELSATYAVRVQNVLKESASFMVYDVNLACGETRELETTLGGFRILLQGADQRALAGQKINLYTQARDANGELVESPKDSLGSFTANTSGEVIVYLPAGSQEGVAGLGDDYYVLEYVSGSQRAYRYNLKAVKGEMKEVIFSLGTIRTRLKYEGGGSAVGLTMEVYTQKLSAQGVEQLGTKVGSYTIGSDGYGTLEVMPDTYAIRVRVDKDYQYFWDLSVNSGQTAQFLLEAKGAVVDKTPGATPTVPSDICQANSQTILTLKNLRGQLLAGLKFEIYEQAVGTGNLASAGAKVANGTTDAAGRAVVSFKPRTDKVYAVKVWDKQANLGSFWFYGALKYVCGYDRSLELSLPALQVVLRNDQGVPKINQAFSLYLQRYNVDGQPILDSQSLIANLKTGSDGQATVYVAPYSAYNEQAGIYAISTKDDQGKTKNYYDLRISEASNYLFDPTFKGVKGEYVSLAGQTLANKSLALYEQRVDNGYLVLGSQLTAVKTEAGGNWQLDYPQGTYALTTPDDFGRTNVFWNVQLNGQSNFWSLKPSLITFKLNPGPGIDPSNSNLKLYSLNGRGGTYSLGSEVATIKLSGDLATHNLAAGVYLATYQGLNNQVYGLVFYAKNNTPFTANIIPSPANLIGGQTIFKIANADSNYVGGGSSSPVVNNSSLAERVKGRILLQVEDKGQAWYVSPVNNQRYSLGRPEEAFQVMRQVSLGISNANFASLEASPGSWRQLAGRILLKVEDAGRAYYFDPVTLKLHYLGRPADAFAIMRNLGLGISNSDLSRISLN